MAEHEDTFGWGDKAEAEESKYVLLPEGEAFFSILKLDRQRKEFGKLGTCNVAVITFLCDSVTDDAKSEVDVQFPLARSMGWKILQLATAVGFRKKGAGNEIDPRWWAQFVGQTGRCKIGHREGKAKKAGDTPKVYNEITEFLEPEAAAEGLQF